MSQFVRLARRLAALIAILVVPSALAFAQPTPKTPTESYLGYRGAMAKAGTFDDLKPWLAKSGLAELDKRPPDERGMMLEMIKDFSSAISNVRVVDETITGDKATLRVEGTDVGDKSTKRGTVEIVREGAVWKFVKESWGGQ